MEFFVKLLFVNRIINADASLYVAQDWQEIAINAAYQKHRKYDKAAEYAGGLLNSEVELITETYFCSTEILSQGRGLGCENFR